jgi:hypothetical protein
MVARSWLVSPLIHRDFRDRYLRVAGVNLASATLNDHKRYSAEKSLAIFSRVSLVVNRGWTAPPEHTRPTCSSQKI